MQRWLLATSLAIIAASAGAQTAAAPETQKLAGVSGVVIDERDGRLLRRVMVCLHSGSDAGYSAPTNDRCNETDAQGRFNLANLPPARYAYSLERDAYFQTEPTADGLASL